MRDCVFPELVTGREDGYTNGPWTLDVGTTARGDASCNLSERILRVPLGVDETSRVVRAHELTHIRVSPHACDRDVWLGAVEPRAIECAEELRVNSLLSRLGFDTSLLRDGSEKSGARRIAEADDWSEAVCFLMAVVGTGAEKDFLSGIRSRRPTWLPGLRALRKRAQQLLEEFDIARLGSTRLNMEGLACGFAEFTVVLATVLTQSMVSRPPQTPEEIRRFRGSLVPGGRRAPTGRFAPLRIDGELSMVQRARSSGLRSSRAAVSGTVMRYPGRLLSDDLQRAFTHTRSVHGGVIVIDQSGSMDIDEIEMAALLRQAPDSLVIGYSHRPGAGEAVANAWILARRGVVAKVCPRGNVGNGVDGPVLEWAITNRRQREPLIWVSDGQVTDSHDHPDEGLTTVCAQLVLRHRILMAANLGEASRTLRVGRPSSSSTWSTFGRVGRRVLELQGNRLN